MADKQLVELTPDQLATVIGYAHQGDLVGTLVATYKAFGYDLTSEECPHFRAMDCQLPMAQWTAICGALQAGSRETNRTRDPIRQVNLMLDWVNKGPSAQDEEDNE